MVKLLTTRKTLLVLAIAILVGGMAVAFHAIPQNISDIDYVLLGVGFATTVPITLALGVFRFHLISGISGAPLSLVKCFEVVVIGTAANLLPIPGAFLVRVHALRHQGLRAGTLSNLIATAIWLGVSASIAGIALFFIDKNNPGWIFITMSIFSITASFIATNNFRLSIAQLPPLLFVQVAISLMDVVRLWIISQTLDIEIGFTGAAILGISGVAGTISGIFPGGIGITEIIAAILAGIFGINPAVGFLIAALNRLLIWAGVLPAALVLAHIARNTRPSAEKR